MNFIERAQYAKNSVAKNLFTIMHEKQTNLCVNIDVTQKNTFLDLVKKVGPEICILKTHIDIIDDFDWDLIEQLKKLATHYNFLIMEDRKFCDIGSVVQYQYTSGIYKIVAWADIVIAHAISGQSIVDSLRQAAGDKPRGMMLLAHMSSAGNLIDTNYSDNVVKMVEENSDFVLGCICQKACLQNPGMLHMTPGVNLSQPGDTLGQRYNTPEKAIIDHGTDIIIVGRGIYKAQDTRAAAQKYRDAAWHAYQTKITNYNEAKGTSFQAG